MMKALVYHGPGNRAWEEKPRLSLQEASDAIVRITRTTICGTALHTMKGNVAIEVMGVPATFMLCQDIVAAGGHIANAGVHGKTKR